MANNRILLRREFIKLEEFTYAQIDNENIAIGISQLSGEIKAENMIRLENYDSNLLGKKYNNGAWEDVHTEPCPEPTPEPTNMELKGLQLAQMEAMATMYEQQEADKINQYEVLATILENTTEVN